MNRVFALAAVALLAPSIAPCQRVTDEANVRVDGRMQHIRKINGRWWSEDNRKQLTPTKDVSWLWQITSDLGEDSVFYHHRPVNLSKVETLHLFMHPDEVRTVLGGPNQADERLEFWRYYAENGTAVFLRFFNGELGEARYERSDFGVHGRPVMSIEEELGGRSIFSIMAQRAGQKSSTAGAGSTTNPPFRNLADFKRHAETLRSPRASSTTVRQETVRLIPREPPARRIAKELLDAIKPGMAREDVVRKLGEATGGLHIAGEVKEAEDLHYALEPDGDVTIHLENGKVARIIR
jgi:hypothetical protein